MRREFYIPQKGAHGRDVPAVYRGKRRLRGATICAQTAFVEKANSKLVREEKRVGICGASLKLWNLENVELCCSSPSGVSMVILREVRHD